MLSYQTIHPNTLELLKRLMAEPLFSQTRLVGGTALALQIGHRSSVDLDLLVQYDEDGISLLKHAAMICDLEKLLDRDVDLVEDGTFGIIL